MEQSDEWARQKRPNQIDILNDHVDSYYDVGLSRIEAGLDPTPEVRIIAGHAIHCLRLVAQLLDKMDGQDLLATGYHFAAADLERETQKALGDAS